MYHLPCNVIQPNYLISSYIMVKDGRCALLRWRRKQPIINKVWASSKSGNLWIETSLAVLLAMLESIFTVHTIRNRSQRSGGLLYSFRKFGPSNLVVWGCKSFSQTVSKGTLLFNIVNVSNNSIVSALALTTIFESYWFIHSFVWSVIF